MAAKIIANIFFLTILAAAQVSFISGLPSPFNKLNLLLVVLIFILGFAGFKLAAWWSLAAAFILEVFLFLPFGVYLVSLTLTIVAANFLLEYFFTNRSLYSFLALVALATVIYELIINFLSLIFLEIDRRLFLLEPNFWLSLLEQIGFNLLLTLVFYYLVHFFGRNLKPVFLTRLKKY